MSELAEMTSLLARHASREGTCRTAITGLSLLRSTVAGKTSTLDVREPMLCVILQGCKQVTTGEITLQYGPTSHLISSVALPVTATVTAGSARKPYLAFSLLIDPKVLTELVVEIGQVPAPTKPILGMAVSENNPEFSNACLRLLRLLDKPEQIKVLAPPITREILYRLLLGAQRDVLLQSGLRDGRAWSVARAAQLIRSNLSSRLKVAPLAAHAGMSQASFFRHFRSVMGMSPLQYQKQLRLIDARRRLLSHPAGIADTAYAVGYSSASQFAREYGRQFGHAPSADAIPVQP